MSERRKVLVVEDADDVRDVISLVLAGLDGIDLIYAGDGDEALALALREQPDVITLDVGLPGKSGLEVCRTLRAASDVKQAKIIMLSAHAQHADRKTGLAAGADVYMTKPFSPMDLFAQVKHFLDGLEGVAPRGLAARRVR